MLPPFESDDCNVDFVYFLAVHGGKCYPTTIFFEDMVHWVIVFYVQFFVNIKQPQQSQMRLT